MITAPASLTAPYTRFRLAYRLTTRISNDLRYGRRHYRTKAGKLLKSLDEVINAILNDELEERNTND